MITLKFNEYKDLNESLRGAILKYPDLPDDTFLKLKSYDPSKSFKYIEALCKFYYDGAKLEDLKKEILTFNNLLDRNQLENRDVNSYTYHQFKNAIYHTSLKYTIKTSKKENEKRYTVFLNDKDYFVTIPHTEMASNKLGKNTTWCTTSIKAGNLFSYYVYKKRLTLYYIENKGFPSRDPFAKIAVLINSNNEIDTIYSAVNEDLKIDDPDLKPWVPLIQTFKWFPIESVLTDEELSYIKYQMDIDLVIKNDDGSIDYGGNLSLKGQNLSLIPFKFRHVFGYFDCSNNKLYSLKNCPEIIDGTFYCSNNPIRIIEYLPVKIGGDFEAKKLPVSIPFHKIQIEGRIR